jgi:hypothetical protein
VFGALTSDRAVFDEKIEPELHRRGAGVEDWLTHLDASGIIVERS